MSWFPHLFKYSVKLNGLFNPSSTISLISDYVMSALTVSLGQCPYKLHQAIIVIASIHLSPLCWIWMCQYLWRGRSTPSIRQFPVNACLDCFWVYSSIFFMTTLVILWMRFVLAQSFNIAYFMYFSVIVCAKIWDCKGCTWCIMKKI